MTAQRPAPRNGEGVGLVTGPARATGSGLTQRSEVPPEPPLEWLRLWAGAYARYAALVREQVDAVRSDDVLRLQALSAERDGLQETIRSWGGIPPGVEGLGAEGRILLEEITAHLREALAQDEELRKTLTEARARLAQELQGLPLRQESARRYLAEAASDPAVVGGGRLDRRF